MAQAAIALGSNLGCGKRNLLEAWHRLTELPEISAGRLSSPYLTNPVGMRSEQEFTNAAGLLTTGRSCPALLAALLGIEREMGRDRSRGRDRTVDLDILYYDDLIVNTKDLIVPHPGLRDRLFVLAPLCEIAPDFRHPVLGLTTQQMLAALGDCGQTAIKSTW